MKPVNVKIIGFAAEEFESLNKIIGDEKAKGISNSEYGDAVPKNLIKRTGYDVDNMWIADLIGYWRMLYTLKGTQVEILCFILEIIDHKKYDKIFGYKKK